MTRTAPKAWWALAIAALALPFVLAACGSPPGAEDDSSSSAPESSASINIASGDNVSTKYGRRKGFDYEPSIVETRPANFYESKLRDLPLHFSGSNFSVHLRHDEGSDVRAAVREVHLLRDVTNSRDDTLLVVFDDLVIISINARDFSINWQSRLDTKRTVYAPVMTHNRIFFIDFDGSYQKFDRQTGTLLDVSNFGPDFYPSTQVVANDTHVAVPTTSRNAIKGQPGERGSSILSSQSWVFPSRQTKEVIDFGLISHPPVADAESVYFVTANNQFYCISATTGEFRFVKDLGQAGMVRSGPILQDDIFYIGSDEGLFAFSRAGEQLWSYNPGNFEVVSGDLYAMDDQVFFQTVNLNFVREPGDRYQSIRTGRTTQADGKLSIVEKPARFGSVHFDRITPKVYDPEGLSPEEPNPIKRDEEGNAMTGVTLFKGPRNMDWDIESRGYKVLLKTGNRLFVQLVNRSSPFDDNERQLLKNWGRVIKDSEFQLIDRNVIQVLDANSGEVISRSGQPWSFEVVDFPFVIGSMDGSDRAIYFATKDGHIFKGFGVN